VVSTTIPVGSGPYGVAVNPLASTVYVANAGSDTVSVIGGRTNTVTATIPVGNEPDAVAVNPLANRAYVANIVDGTVSVISG
jgi:YVTN family beta-propeller protein